MKICRENSNLFKIGQKYWTLYMPTYIRMLLLSAKLNRHKSVIFE